jgi:hypothetical protein
MLQWAEAESYEESSGGKLTLITSYALKLHMFKKHTSKSFKKIIFEFWYVQNSSLWSYFSNDLRKIRLCYSMKTVA